jgi:hypothetical protein
MKRRRVWVIEIDEFNVRWQRKWEPCTFRVFETREEAMQQMDDERTDSAAYYRYRVRPYYAKEEEKP